ncbi:hypothetical protein BVRB_2g039850 [Beta vulgaris subsp. vulgaris]|nr:hypothetical protein BVRB_2g039850 [Beta vulgaris subsp. vulgaris]
MRRKGDPTHIIDEKLKGSDPDILLEMQEMLNISLYCVSRRVEDRPTMKDVVAMLMLIRRANDPSAEPQGLMQDLSVPSASASHSSIQ